LNPEPKLEKREEKAALKEIVDGNSQIAEAKSKDVFGQNKYYPHNIDSNKRSIGALLSDLVITFIIDAARAIFGALVIGFILDAVYSLFYHNSIKSTTIAIGFVFSIAAIIYEKMRDKK
jgi:hypothetical protein